MSVQSIYSKIEFANDWFIHCSVALLYAFIIGLISPKLTFEALPPLLIGTLLIDIIDHPAYVYITNRGKETSIEVRKLVSKGHFIDALKFWSENHKKENRLLIHSVLGQPILAVIFFYLAANNFFGPSFYLVLGMFLHTIVDQSLDLKRMRHLKHWFFWPIPEKIETTVMIFYYLIMLGILSFSSLYFLI